MQKSCRNISLFEIESLSLYQQTKVILWQTQENTRLDAAARVGAFGRLQRVIRSLDLGRIE